jgi:hypothetical protein
VVEVPHLESVKRHAPNLKWRIRLIAERLETPTHLITFQVMRRSLGTHLSTIGAPTPTAGFKSPSALMNEGIGANDFAEDICHCLA